MRCNLAGVTTLMAGLCLSAHGQVGEPDLATELVAGNLSGALYLTHAPGDYNRLFVVVRSGRIRIIEDGQTLTAPFLDIASQVNTSGERGMLGMAFHPDYQSNGLVYVRYNNSSGATVITRYQVSSSNPDVLNTASAQTVISSSNVNANHNGGWIEFGNDGMLYVSVGDDDDFDNAQDITGNLHGKILRLDVNGDDFPADSNRNYRIPPGNPFVGVSGDDEIWAYGLRNPFRCSIDQETGDLWIGDVGELEWEEVDFQPAGLAGVNYGWDCREGAHCVPSQTCVCTDPDLVDPIFEYSHGEGCAITGGRVYRGCAIPDLQGTYFVGDFCSANIWSFRFDGKSTTDLQQRHVQLDPPGSLSIDQIVGFGEDAYGELYICDLGGEIYKIVPASPPPDSNGNGIPDACEGGSPPAGDINQDGSVDTDDLLAVINSWGPCAPPCAADTNQSGAVDTDDLLVVINGWN